MNTKHSSQISRLWWLLGVLSLAALACGVSGEVDSARATVQSASASARSVLATVQAFATQQAPLLETAIVMATEQGPEMLETAQAAATQVAFGQRPADIPMVDQATVDGLVVSNVLVSYRTSQAYADVVAFYKTSMSVNQWSAISGERVETDAETVIRYEKGDRVATLTVTPQDAKTIVLIVIQTK